MSACAPSDFFLLCLVQTDKVTNQCMPKKPKKNERKPEKKNKRKKKPDAESELEIQKRMEESKKRVQGDLIAAQKAAEGIKNSQEVR